MLSCAIQVYAAQMSRDKHWTLTILFSQIFVCIWKGPYEYNSYELSMWLARRCYVSPALIQLHFLTCI